MEEKQVKAVILAAGKGTRMYEITESGKVYVPKPLVVLNGMTLIGRNLAKLDGLIDQAIFITGYKSDTVNFYLELVARSNVKFDFEYVRQNIDADKGTAKAVESAEPFIKEDDTFFVMMSDNLYTRGDIKECLKHKNSILGYKMDDPTGMGVLKLSGDKLESIVEKPEGDFSYLANGDGQYLINTGFYVFTGKDIFNIIRELQPSKRGEYEITDALNTLAKKTKIEVVNAVNWMPVGTVEEYDHAIDTLL